MPFYESVLIARQDISAQQVEGLTEALQNVVTENGGTVAKTEYWGLRNLAYRIKKNRKGHYLMLHLDAPAEAVKELERNARINEDVLRHLTIRVDNFEEGPSVMMQTRSARDSGRRDRGDRDRGDRGDRDRGDRDRGDRDQGGRERSERSGE
jgi:small subunit ribosomal protein S6